MRVAAAGGFLQAEESGSRVVAARPVGEGGGILAIEVGDGEADAPTVDVQEHARLGRLRGSEKTWR